MKKTLLFIFAFFTIHLLSAQTNVPNGGLEDWHEVVVTASLEYMQPGINASDTWLTTLNELAAVPPPIGPGPITVFRTDDAHSGSYAARLVSENFPLIPNDVFIPGMLGTCKMVMTESRALLGRASTSRPVKLSGWFKSMPVNGDSTTAVILVSKWNAATKHRDTLGFGEVVFTDPVETYTQFEIPVVYTDLTTTPDSLTILCVASAGFSAVNLMGGQGQVGSTMYIDDLMLEYAAGIPQVLMPEVKVVISPNPARDVLNVQLDRTVDQGLFTIYDISGKRVMEVPANGLQLTINVAGLPAGEYFYMVGSKGAKLNSGAFLIRD